MVLWRPTGPSRTNTPKRCSFHYRGLECKSRKSRDTWSNRQVWPWNTKWSRSKANRVLPTEYTVIANTLFQQPKRWRSPNGQYWNRTDYILCSQRWRSSIQSAKTRRGADSSLEPELLIAKYGLKLKESKEKPLDHSGMTYQIPYDYTVEVRNRFKGLDLIDRVPEELWTEVHNIVQEVVIKPSPRKRNAERQNGCLRRPYK